MAPTGHPRYGRTQPPKAVTLPAVEVAIEVRQSEFPATLTLLAIRGPERAGREKQGADVPEPVVEAAECDDLLSLLDQELSRLPDKHRVVIVLGDLDAGADVIPIAQMGEEGDESALRVPRSLLIRYIQARLARHQYDALLRYADHPQGLATWIDRARERDARNAKHGLAGRAGLQLAHLATLGIYSHQDPVPLSDAPAGDSHQELVHDKSKPVAPTPVAPTENTHAAD